MNLKLYCFLISVHFIFFLSKPVGELFNSPENYAPLREGFARVSCDLLFGGCDNKELGNNGSRD